MPTIILNSTFLDFTSHGMTTATNVVEAYGITGGNVPATRPINVALVPERAEMSGNTALVGVAAPHAVRAGRNFAGQPTHRVG